MEERVHGGLGPRERRGVRARGASAGHGRPALHRQDRLLPRNSARNPPESPRVPERLQVERNQSGLGVVLPVLEQVVGRDVGLVANGNECREADPALLRLLEEGEAERAALGRERDRARWKRARPERRVQSRRGDREAEAVGPDQPTPVRPNQGKQLVLERTALLPHLGKARRDDADRAGAVPQGRLHAGEHVTGRKADDGEVRRLGELLGRAIAPDTRDSVSGRVNRIGHTLELAGDDVPEEQASDRLAPLRRAEDGHARRAKNGRSEATAARWSRSSTRSR